MRTTLSAVLLTLALALPAAAAKPTRTRLAVMDIKAIGTDAYKAEVISEIALTEAGNDPRFEVMGRSDIAEMLGLERQKQLLGCSEDSCLAEMAGGLGVDYVLVGSLGKIGAVLQLNMKIIDSKKSRVLLRKGVTVSGAEEKLVEVVQKLTREMVAGIPSRDAPALKATVTPAMAVPVPEPVAGVVSPPPADSPAAPMTRRSWSYLFGGAGLAAVGTGAIFGGLSLSAYHQEQDAAKAHDRAAYDAARSSSALRSNVADVLYLAGAAGLGVGAYLFFTGEPAATVTLAPIRGGASAVFTLELP